MNYSDYFDLVAEYEADVNRTMPDHAIQRLQRLWLERRRRRDALGRPPERAPKRGSKPL